MKRWLVACVVALLCTPPLAAAALDLRARIDPLARALLDDGVAVGSVVGILKDGRTHVIAYGETGSGVAPNGDTVYEIGSISKVFTSVVLADMTLRGIVKLDDPVQRHLPPNVKVPVFDGKPITLEHLATQTSGLPRMPDNFHPANPSNPYADYRVEQLYAFLAGYTLTRPPGQYEYSNYGMGLLGHVLARRNGTTYEQLVIERIATPLGMNDTRITLNDDLRARLARPYAEGLRPAANWDIPTLAGAGAIRSTVNDMLKFIQASLASDDTPLTRALRLSHRQRHAMENGLAMGLGWLIARDGITRWHNGMTGGYHGWLAVTPTHSVGVIVLANTATMRISAFGEQVTRIALAN